MTLQGRTILVTGGARRIGAEIARCVARLGGKVVIHCNKSVDDASRLIAEIAASGGSAHPAPVQCDFSKPENIPAFLDSLPLPIDGAVNCASAYSDAIPYDELRNIHVESPLLLLDGLLKLQQGPLAVVNVTDCRVFDQRHADYMRTKNELAAMTAQLALKLAPRVRVNAVAPGIVLESEGDPSIERLSQCNPLRRHGTPGGLADVVAMLLASDFITGQTIRYDGGYSLARPSAEVATDRISLRGLELECYLGVYEEEQKAPRKVLFDIDIFADISKAAESDALADTSDYGALARRIAAAVGPESGRRFQLVETLAKTAAEVCLDFAPSATSATVTAIKPAPAAAISSSSASFTLSKP